jgi:hypothetical protein
VSVVKSDETTTLADLTSVSTNVGATYVESTVTLTKSGGAQSKADWDAARLRIFQDYTISGCADTTTRLRVSAAQVTVTYSTVQTVAVTTATETDSAPALGAVQKARAIGVASETDTAPGVGKARPITAATETDTAGTVTLGTGQNIAVTEATETDTAPAIGRSKAKAIGLASETDTAPAVGRRHAKALTTATETDSAPAARPAHSKALTLASETDTAPALGARLKAKAITAATSTETALAITAQQPAVVALSPALETDEALPITVVGGAQAAQAAASSGMRAAHGPLAERSRQRRRPGTFGPEPRWLEIGDDPEDFGPEESEGEQRLERQQEDEPDAPDVEVPAPSEAEIVAAQIRGLDAVMAALALDPQAQAARLLDLDAAIAAATEQQNRRRAAIALLLLVE